MTKPKTASGKRKYTATSTPEATRPTKTRLGILRKPRPRMMDKLRGAK